MITYRGPIERPIVNPSDEFVRNIIFKKTEDYWKQGSGDSSFEIEGCDESFILFYDEPYGFFIMRHPDYLVPLNKSIEIKTVEHFVGGEAMHVPSCSYLNRDLAYKVIKEFMATKTIPSFIEWTDLYEIDFDHGF
ncbi:hypothetical protein HOO54_15380 [Bacillus sp. WMMC1349]|nr:hypothetical protein [Bacillus sp. WMMC1349]NPC93582.1 hypothetical protein [Bacillus sp. WMMC1349]